MPRSEPKRITAVRPIDEIFRGDEPGNGREHLVRQRWLRVARDRVAFGPSAGGVIGISAERECLWWAVCGPGGVLSARRIDVEIAPIGREGMRPDELRELLVEVLRGASEQLPEGRLAGVGIAWPGAIGRNGEPLDYAFHHSDFTDPDTLEPRPLRPLVRAALAEAGLAAPAIANGAPLPALQLVNDADADLMYATRHGVAKGRRNVLGLKVGGGLGLAVMLDGRLVRGHTGAAGEIQHVKVRYEEAELKGGRRHNVRDLDALDLCWCGDADCIARFATGKAIIDQLSGYGAGSGSYNRRGWTIQEANRGDVGAAFGRAGRLLGEALLGPVLAFDPECLVVKAFPRNPHLVSGLASALTEGTTVRLDGDAILTADWDGTGTAAGAARVVIEDSLIPRLEQALFDGTGTVRRHQLPAWLRHQVGLEADHLCHVLPSYGADR